MDYNTGKRDKDPELIYTGGDEMSQERFDSLEKKEAEISLLKRAK